MSIPINTPVSPLRKRLLLTALPALALLHPGLLPAPAWAANEGIGVAAAVNPDAVGQPPAMDKRIIEVGTNMLVDERITTGPNGQAQLIFRDGSAFSIGPNSDLTLDKFVYDPAKGSGEIALSVTKGVFRFVGGKISKDNPVQIKTGSATMGIRGGIATLNVAPGQPVVGRFLFGREMSMTQNGVTQVTTRPGTAIDVPFGAPPSPPRAVSAQEMRESSSQLEGGSGGQQSGGPAGGQSGGAPAGAIEGRLDSSGVSNSNSAPPPGGIAPVGPPPPPAQRANNPPGGLNPQLQGAAQNASQSVSNNQSSTTNQAAQTQNPNNFTYSLLSGMFGRFLIGDNGTMQPFTGFNNLDYNVTASSEYSQTPEEYERASNGAFFRATVAGTSAQPNATSLVFPSTTGFFSLSGVGNPYGSFSGIGYANAARDFFFYGLQSGADTKLLMTAGKATDPINFPTTGLAAYNMLGGLSTIPLIGETVPNGDPSRNAAVYSPLYAAYNDHLTPTDLSGGDARSVMLQASIGISGQGSSQTSFMAGTTAQFGLDEQSNEMVAMGGVTGSYRRSGNSNAPIALRSDLSTQAVDDTHSAIFGNSGQYMVLSTDNLTPNSGTGAYDRTTQVGIATPLEPTTTSDNLFVDVAVRSTTNPSILDNPTRSTRTIQGYAAALLQRADAGNNLLGTDVKLLTQSNDPLSVTISTSATNNRAEANFVMDGEGTPYELTFGGLSGNDDARSAFVNDKLYAMRESPLGNGTVNGNSVTQASNLLVSSDVASVDSSFLPSGVTLCSSCQGLSWGWWLSTLNRSDNNYTENAHLATYVTGVLPDTLDIPLTGTARFGGHAIGSVQNGTNRYVAVGSFDAAWNFGTKSGLLSLSNFDSLNLTGTASSTNGREFSGSLTGGTVTGSLDGSFFSEGADPTRYMGGQFSLSDTGYSAAGTFAAGTASAAVTDLYSQGWRGRYFRLDNTNAQYPYTGFDNNTLAITPDANYNSPVTGISRIGNSWFRVTTAAGDFYFQGGQNSTPQTVDNSNTFSPFDDFSLSNEQQGTFFYPTTGSFFFASLNDLVDPTGTKTVIYGGQPTTFAQFPTSGLSAYSMATAGNPLPFAPQGFLSSLPNLAGEVTVGSLYSAYSSVLTGAAMTGSQARSVFLQASIGIYGQGAAQQSIMLGSTGTYTQEGALQSVMLTGGLRGSARLADLDPTVRLTGGVASADTGDGNAIYGAGAQHMVLVPDGTTYNGGTQQTTRIDQAAFQQPQNNLTGSDYYFTELANRQASPGTELTTPTRSNLNYNGYAAGLVEAYDNTNTPLGQDYTLTSGSSASNVTITTNAATNRAQASFALSDPGNSQTYDMQFGSLTGTQGGNSSFINDSLFGMRESFSTASQVNGVTTNARSFMVTHQVAEISASALPGGVTLCACDYLQWGWWITDISHDNASSPTPDQRDRVHMATWVAGELPSLAEIPVTGTATFDGHAIANVNNNGSRYVAIGSFSQSWNFATQAGNVTISNFDGIAPITGAVTAANGRDFAGTLSATGGYTGSLNGSFFKGGGDPTNAAGGNFTLTNTSYTAGGTFAAQKQ